MSHYEQEFQSSPDYVLNFIRWISNPYTPFINMQVDGVSSPFDHIHFSTLTNFYRFFDVLAYRKIFSNDVLILFINNVLKYGYDYALSITLNPLIEVMVDLDKKCLKKKFIDKLGHDLYARMLEKIGNDHQLLSSQLIYSLRMMLFQSLMDPKFIQLEPRAIFIQIHLGMLYFPLSEDLVQLYEKKRILISNHMTEDLRSCDAGFQDYRELYESSFNQSSEPSYQEFLPYLKYLLLLKYKKQSGNTSARIDEIISKYDLATLVNKKHQAKMNLANPDLTTEEKNNLKNEINDINHLIRGACANYQQSQKQLHQIMIAASVTIVAMAAIASLTFGIVFIPLIPLSYGIISLIISGAIGSSMVGFFGIKYRNNLQKYFDYEKEVEACSNPTIESSTLLTGTL